MQMIIVKITATLPVVSNAAVNIFVFAIAIFTLLSAAAETPFINSTTFSLNVVAAATLPLYCFLPLFLLPCFEQYLYDHR